MRKYTVAARKLLNESIFKPKVFFNFIFPFIDFIIEISGNTFLYISIVIELRPPFFLWLTNHIRHGLPNKHTYIDEVTTSTG